MHFLKNEFVEQDFLDHSFRFTRHYFRPALVFCYKISCSEKFDRFHAVLHYSERQTLILTGFFLSINLFHFCDIMLGSVSKVKILLCEISNNFRKKKESCSLGVSLVNVAKCQVSCGFIRISQRNLIEQCWSWIFLQNK